MGRILLRAAILPSDGEGQAKDQNHSSNGDDCRGHPARPDVKESTREKRGGSNAGREPDSQLNHVTGSGPLIPRAAEALSLEQRREQATHCEQRSQRKRSCHDEVLERTHILEHEPFAVTEAARGRGP